MHFEGISLHPFTTYTQINKYAYNQIVDAHNITITRRGSRGGGGKRVLHPSPPPSRKREREGKEKKGNGKGKKEEEEEEKKGKKEMGGGGLPPTLFLWTPPRALRWPPRCSFDCYLMPETPELLGALPLDPAQISVLPVSQIRYQNMLI